MEISSFDRFTAGILFICLLFIISFLTGCTNKESSQTLNTSYKDHIDTSVSVYGPYVAVRLPITKGVKISNPIQIAMSPAGVMYATNSSGEVYSLQDSDNDGLEDTAVLYCNVKDVGLRSPAGLTFRGDSVYVGTAQQIRIFLDKNNDAKADTSWVFFDDIPNSEHPYEWTNCLNFGPDGWLYFTLTTDSWNAAPSPDPNSYRGAILRISPDGKKVERLATGIRSVYGMSFNGDGQLFFTDNEGGGNPNEELNRLVTNRFYGHNPKKYKTDSITKPELALETEMAPSGIEFNKAENDFGGTSGNLFVAFYGPGERWTRGGIGRVKVERMPDGNYSYEEFPVADIPKLSDLAFGKDGALYAVSHGMSDYWFNVIHENQGVFYKLIYDPSITTMKEKPSRKLDKSFSKNSLEQGKQLFAEQACLGCHQVDGVTELLGPNLKDVGKQMTRDEILEEILEPSARIKPSMQAMRVTKKDGQVLVGRVISSDENEINLILVGNQIAKVSRKDIQQTQNETQSLMYEGLLNNLEDSQKEALLDYIISLSN